jgi:SAM-dependent methyltransferase
MIMTNHFFSEGDFYSRLEASLYDLYNPLQPGELDFWRSLAKEFACSGEVLELGCGTMRLGIPLAADGFTVYGIDKSRYMLSKAARKIYHLPTLTRSRLKCFEHDMSCFDLKRKFDFIFVPYNTFSILGAINREKEAINCIYNHLSSSGVAVIELQYFNKEILSDESQRPWKEFFKVKINDGLIAKRDVSIRVCNSTSLIHAVFVTNISDNNDKIRCRWKNTLTIKYHYKKDIIDIIYNGGFQIVNYWSDYTRKSFCQKDEPKGQILVIKKRT